MLLEPTQVPDPSAPDPAPALVEEEQNVFWASVWTIRPGKIVGQWKSGCSGIPVSFKWWYSHCCWIGFFFSPGGHSKEILCINFLIYKWTWSAVFASSCLFKYISYCCRWTYQKVVQGQPESMCLLIPQDWHPRKLITSLWCLQHLPHLKHLYLLALMHPRVTIFLRKVSCVYVYVLFKKMNRWSTFDWIKNVCRLFALDMCEVTEKIFLVILTLSNSQLRAIPFILETSPSMWHLHSWSKSLRNLDQSSKGCPS